MSEEYQLLLKGVERGHIYHIYHIGSTRCVGIMDLVSNITRSVS